jgi:hypothetical protein
MGGAEGVVHVEVAQRREARGEAGIVGLFAGEEAGVFRDRHTAAREPPGLGHSLVGERVAEEGHRCAQQALELTDHRFHGILRVDPALGPAEVGEQHDSCPAAPEKLDGRQRGPDPGVVGDLPVLDRAIEVHPHQRAFAIEGGGVERLERALHSRSPTYRSRSTHRAE